MTDVSFNIGIQRKKLTRPSNTNTYTAGDCISSVNNNEHFIFKLLRENFKNEHYSATVERALITSSADVATPPDLELWFFSEDIAKVADESAFAPSDAEMDTWLGTIVFPTGDFIVGLTTGTGNQGCPAENQHLVLKSDREDVYAQLVVRNAYVATSAEVFQVSLFYQQD